MTENKRFYCKKDGTNQWTVSDRLNQYPMPITSLEFCSVVANVLNGLWEQTVRFEKYNQEYMKENEQLKQQNKELKLDNDIKFWKHQFMMSYNTSQIIMHEISRAIDEGYKVSEEFQKYLNELKVQNDENKEKMERLGI